jgi:hypothetical protein
MSHKETPLSNIDDVIAAAERKAKKVAAFVGLLRDPDLKDLVDALQNGSTRAPARRTATPKPAVDRVGLRATIRSQYDRLPQKFGRDDVVGLLQAEHFKFDRNPQDAVRDQLHALEKAGELRIVKRGKAGVPNVYEVVYLKEPEEGKEVVG